MRENYVKKSRFIISLDFELFWGVRDKRTLQSYGPNIIGVREVIPALLELFEKYDIHATFATVGFLFAETKDDIKRFLPEVLPHYVHTRYSPYDNNYLEKIGECEADDLYHYGWSLLKMIQMLPSQEIASHTFSHFYCLEGASLESFKADLKSAINIAAARNISLKTIIFPRNQYSAEHLKVCKEEGFIAYRGNQSSSVYNPRQNEEQTSIIRGIRLADSYINITGHHNSKPQPVAGILNLPASRFLRPYSNKLRVLDGLRSTRICDSLSAAASSGMDYHLWWHPHNFGSNLKENLLFLENILKYFTQLRSQFGMQSRSMKEIAEEQLQTYAD